MSFKCEFKQVTILIGKWKLNQDYHLDIMLIPKQSHKLKLTVLVQILWHSPFLATCKAQQHKKKNFLQHSEPN